MRFLMPVAAAAGSLTLAAALSGVAAIAPAAVTGTGTASPAAAVVVIRPDSVHAAGALKSPPTTAFCEHRLLPAPADPAGL